MNWPKITVTEHTESHGWTLCVTLVLRCCRFSNLHVVLTGIPFLLDVDKFALQHETFYMNRMWNVNPVASVRKFRRVSHSNSIHNLVSKYLMKETAAPEETSWSTTRSLKLLLYRTTGIDFVTHMIHSLL